MIYEILFQSLVKSCYDCFNWSDKIKSVTIPIISNCKMANMLTTITFATTLFA